MHMRIYFTAAITDIPPDHQEKYRLIVAAIKALGHRVQADHIIGKTAQMLKGQSEVEAMAIYRRMIVWENQADLMVVEASYPSFGVGQEITYALTNNKPVIALHLSGRRPHLLLSVGTEYLHVTEYSPSDVKAVLVDYIEYARETADTRFNFFISSEIDAFLDWVVKKRRLPRAVFLRQLIEEDLKKNTRYLREIGTKKKTKRSPV